MQPKNRWKRTSTITVDLDLIRENALLLREKVKKSQIMAVVKADAYGHGSVQVAEALKDIADWFAVNDVEEGVELRQADIDQPILVFGVPDTENAELYSAYSLTATVGDMHHFGLLPAGTEYHLNFDTGMGRLGFRPEDFPQVESAVENHPELICSGIYSHFATSDNPGSNKVADQIRTFRKIRQAFPDHLITHLANTGGSSFYKDVAFDMVRSGIGLYGYPPGETAIADVQPALAWHSYLCQVKVVEKGDTVSYGARWSAPEAGYVGVLPVGYSDGLSRALSGAITFKIDGKAYPQVGAITMNYTMVYLGRDRYAAGKKVELLDRKAGTLMEWARKLQTIPYEVLTSISPWVPRIYKGGAPVIRD